MQKQFERLQGNYTHFSNFKSQKLLAEHGKSLLLVTFANESLTRRANETPDLGKEEI